MIVMELAERMVLSKLNVTEFVAPMVRLLKTRPPALTLTVGEPASMSASSDPVTARWFPVTVSVQLFELFQLLSKPVFQQIEYPSGQLSAAASAGKMASSAAPASRATRVLRSKDDSL